MPGFIPAGQQQLARGIALDEAVLEADGVEVVKKLVVHGRIAQRRVVHLVEEVHREAQLVFAAAGIGRDGLGLLHRLLVARIEVHLLFHRHAQTHGDLGGLAVEQTLLIGIAAVTAADVDAEAVVAQILQHGLQLGQGRDVKVLRRALDLRHIRLIEGVEDMVGVLVGHEGIAGLVDIDVGPDVHGRLRRVIGRGIDEGGAVAADKAVLRPAEDHVRTRLSAGDDDGIQHEHQRRHAQQPGCFISFHSSNPLGLQIACEIAVYHQIVTNSSTARPPSLQFGAASSPSAARSFSSARFSMRET